MAPNWFKSIFGEGVRLIRIDPVSPYAFLFLAPSLVYLWRRRNGAGYLVCFSLFFLYMWAVVSYTIFDLPVSSMEIQRIRQFPWSESLNVIPGRFPGGFDPTSIQVYGNVAMGVPFGVGLPFVARTTHRRVMATSHCFAAGIEVAQLLISLIVYRGPYRTIDINDVWLVFLGTVLGHALLVVAARVYRRSELSAPARLPVLSHFHSTLLAVAPGQPGSGRPGV